MYTKILFRLSFNRSDKKTPTLALICSETYFSTANFLSDLLKESLNKLFVYMVPELYLQALRLLMMKTEEKRLIPRKSNFLYDILTIWKCLEFIFLPYILKWVQLNTIYASNLVFLFDLT
jgi:hypothetical protein